MSDTIYKYTLALADRQTVMMPQGAEILHVADRGGKLEMWARVDPQRTTLPRRFAVVGTGHEIDFEPAMYVGTVPQGFFVWHIFELSSEQGA